MDNPHDHHPEKDTAAAPPTPTQAELEAVLDADEADVAAGRTVPLEPVLAKNAGSVHAGGGNSLTSRVWLEVVIGSAG